MSIYHLIYKVKIPDICSFQLLKYEELLFPTLYHYKLNIFVLRTFH